MGLKQSIVIVNQYTTKLKHRGGTRGGTPGNYVLRYMGRDLATETLTPVRLNDTDRFITRYMARKTAAETLNTLPEVKNAMKRAQGAGGVAFGYGDVSLSHRKLKACSKDIQRQFDAGKTVMKTVLSFDEAYLRQYNLVSDDFEFQKRGDYRGHIDQLKLRMAIMNGMQRLSRDYDDLQYIGVIQVDTAHVHCHIAAVDRGRGRIMPDGKQKGKIDDRGKKAIRRGIDMYLDEVQHVPMLASSVMYDRQNAVGFIKKFTHRVLAEHGTPQFLLACLPDDQRLWRASTNRQEMRKPNAIVREYVQELLRQPDSGYKDALRSIDRYAAERRSREDLSGEEYRRLIRDGKARLVEDCMNSVYGVLKKIPEAERKVKAPMLDVMAQDYETLVEDAENDPLSEFAFRLSSYSSRLQHHRKETQKYHEAVSTFQSTTNTSASAQALLKFFQYEEEYNAKLMCKYQHLLPFLRGQEEFEEEYEQLSQYRRRVQAMQDMRRDKNMPRMQSDRAEAHGRQVYGMHGGRYAVLDPSVLETRQEAMELHLGKLSEAFRYKLAQRGLTLDENGISKKKPYSFEDVKALDIHHLAYDWPYDTNVAKMYVDQFVETAVERYGLYEGAKYYLEQSGQGDMVDLLPGKDVEAMHELAMALSQTRTLYSNKPGGSTRKRPRTVDFDTNLDQTVRAAVRSTVAGVAELSMDDK